VESTTLYISGKNGKLPQNTWNDQINDRAVERKKRSSFQRFKKRQVDLKEIRS